MQLTSIRGPSQHLTLTMGRKSLPDVTHRSCEVWESFALPPSAIKGRIEKLVEAIPSSEVRHAVLSHYRWLTHGGGAYIRIWDVPRRAVHEELKDA